MGPSSLESSRAIVAADHVEVVDNFGAADLEQKFQDVAKRISPCVVAISATESTVDTETTLRSDELNPEKLAGMLETVDRTVGTGFIVDADGYILTNDHVVANAEQLWVTTDAHKVLNVPYDCGVAFVRDAKAHRAAMTLSTSYLPAQGDARDEIDWNPEFSRRARGFAVYDICDLHRRQSDDATFQMDVLFAREDSALRSEKPFFCPEATRSLPAFALRNAR